MSFSLRYARVASAIRPSKSRGLKSAPSVLNVVAKPRVGLKDRHMCPKRPVPRRPKLLDGRLLVEENNACPNPEETVIHWVTSTNHPRAIRLAGEPASLHFSVMAG